jgi:hypothetical protein
MEILSNDDEKQSSSFTEIYVWGGMYSFISIILFR